MSRLWRGASVILSMIVIFSLFYFYIQHDRYDPAGKPPEREAAADTSIPDTSVVKSKENNRPATPADSSTPPNVGPSEENTPAPDDSGNDDSNSTTLPASSSNFVVFDGTNYHPKPSEIARSGLEPIDVIYSTRMFDGRNARMLKAEGTMELPPKDVVTELARRAEQINDIAVIDIEHWPLDINKAEDEVVNHSLNNHLTVLEWYKQAAPELEWGYYGEVPIRNYWAAIRPRTSERYQAWMKANDKLQPLADNIDAFFVSLYTFYDDRNRWVRYAEEHVAEARRLNPDIPVYVFLWPEYHMSNDEIGLTPIEPEFWKLQLETAQDIADGVVIYTRGSDHFDPFDPWWKITEDFVTELIENSLP